MTWVLLVVAILVVAGLLYLGNRSWQRRRIEKAREAEKLEEKVGDHRAMAADHDARADELREEAERVRVEADREATKAERHASRADDLDPDQK